ncbi:type II toxin-antitoxin system RelE family toxin [Viscerimonas tarda]
MYKIIIKKKALKNLKIIPANYYKLIVSHVDELANNPRPFGVKKLKAEEEKYRIRVGNYRIVYTIEDKILTVYIIDIDHRGKIYARM